MTPLLFVDVETTGLDPARHDVWEVALVRRDQHGDSEYVWQLPVDEGDADPVALSIGKFYERRWPDQSTEAPNAVLAGRFDVVLDPTLMFSWARTFARLTHGGVFVAANPTFDAAFLGPLLRRLGACPGWHYRLVCVESMAVGFLHGLDRYQHGVDLPPVPWKGVSDLAERLGVEVVEESKHSALADAQKVRNVYDAVVSRS